MKKEKDLEEEDVVSATEMTGMIPSLPITEAEKESIAALFRKPKKR